MEDLPPSAPREQPQLVRSCSDDSHRKDELDVREAKRKKSVDNTVVPPSPSSKNLFKSPPVARRKKSIEDDEKNLKKGKRRSLKEKLKPLIQFDGGEEEGAGEEKKKSRTSSIGKKKKNGEITHVEEDEGRFQPPARKLSSPTLTNHKRKPSFKDAGGGGEKDKDKAKKKKDKAIKKENEEERRMTEQEQEKVFPRAVLQLVFLYLSPRDLGICGKVQRRWQVEACADPVWKTFWREMEERKLDWQVKNWRQFHKMSCAYPIPFPFPSFFPPPTQQNFVLRIII